MNTLIEEWVEWKQKCALGLCGESTKRSLSSFASNRLIGQFNKHKYMSNLPDSFNEIKYMPHWHLFETHLLLTHTRQGKSYKEWLFARLDMTPDDPCSVIEAGACGILRDVMRKLLKDDYNPPNIDSMQAPKHGQDASGLTVGDYIPSETIAMDDVWLNDWTRLAEKTAAGFFNTLSWRERVAVLAKKLGMSLYCPEVLAVAGCKKSVLNTAYVSLFGRFVESIKREFAKCDNAEKKNIVRIAWVEMQELSVEWGRLEAKCSNLFDNFGRQERHGR